MNFEQPPLESSEESQENLSIEEFFERTKTTENLSETGKAFDEITTAFVLKTLEEQETL